MIKPVGKYILIQVVRPTVDTGIILPDSIKPTDEKYVVVSTGSQCELGLKPGDEVAFKENVMSIALDKVKRLATVHETSVVAIVNYEETESFAESAAKEMLANLPSDEFIGA